MNRHLAILAVVLAVAASATVPAAAQATSRGAQPRSCPAAPADWAPTQGLSYRLVTFTQMREIRVRWVAWYKQARPHGWAADVQSLGRMERIVRCVGRRVVHMSYVPPDQRAALAAALDGVRASANAWAAAKADCRDWLARLVLPSNQICWGARASLNAAKDATRRSDFLMSLVLPATDPGVARELRSCRSLAGLYRISSGRRHPCMGPRLSRSAFVPPA